MRLWRALRAFWDVFWYDRPVGQPLWVTHVDQLMCTDITGAVKIGLDKLEHEPIYPGRPRLYDIGSGPEKKREVIKTAYAYAKSMGHAPEDVSEWHLNFMVELLHGMRTGKI